MVAHVPDHCLGDLDAGVYRRGDTSQLVVGGRSWTSNPAGLGSSGGVGSGSGLSGTSKSGSRSGSFSQVSSHQSGRMVLSVKARSKPARSRRSTSEWNDLVASRLAVKKADLASDDRVECGDARVGTGARVMQLCTRSHRGCQLSVDCYSLRRGRRHRRINRLRQSSRLPLGQDLGNLRA